MNNDEVRTTQRILFHPYCSSTNSKGLIKKRTYMIYIVYESLCGMRSFLEGKTDDVRDKNGDDHRRN